MSELYAPSLRFGPKWKIIFEQPTPPKPTTPIFWKGSRDRWASDLDSKFLGGSFQVVKKTLKNILGGWGRDNQLDEGLKSEQQPCRTGSTRLLLSTRISPQNSKRRIGGPKMTNRVWKGVYPQVFGHSCQLSLNKYYVSSTPSMRKGCDGEVEEEEEEKRTSWG